MRHECHYPECSLIVPPKMLACRRHWFQLPAFLRQKIWAAYVPGQEVRKDPSANYLEAFEDCQRWWKAHSKPLAQGEG
jgi:hypothetical protein